MLVIENWELIERKEDCPSEGGGEVGGGVGPINCDRREVVGEVHTNRPGGFNTSTRAQYD